MPLPLERIGWQQQPMLALATVQSRRSSGVVPSATFIEDAYRRAVNGTVSELSGEPTA